MKSHILKNLSTLIELLFSVVKFRGGKVSPNPFAHPNPPTLIKLKPTQLLVGLNGHQPN